MEPGAELDAVASLLAGCAGLPLAVSVMAARADAHPRLPLAALAAELREAATRLDALDVGDLASSVRAVLSWSFHALDAEAATAVRLLGLAPGPDISLAAAASLTTLPAARARAVLRTLGERLPAAAGDARPLPHARPCPAALRRPGQARPARGRAARRAAPDDRLLPAHRVRRLLAARPAPAARRP